MSMGAFGRGMSCFTTAMPGRRGGVRGRVRNSHAISDAHPRSRGAMRPRFAGKGLTLQSEGAGNAGRPMRPIAARAMIVVERTRVSQVTPESPGIPRAMVYGLLRALPGDRAFLPPSPAGLTANLTPASGRQDHTTSPSASTLLVCSANSVHRIPPRVRDDLEPPLCEAGRRWI
jgi:hypothetical protein